MNSKDLLFEEKKKKLQEDFVHLRGKDGFTSVKIQLQIYSATKSMKTKKRICL